MVGATNVHIETGEGPILRSHESEHIPTAINGVNVTS